MQCIILPTFVSDPLPGIADPTKEISFFFLIFFCKRYNTQTMFFWGNLWAYYSCVINKKKDFLKKNYILLISVVFYVRLSRFFLVPGSGSTFPEVDSDAVK